MTPLASAPSAATSPTHAVYSPAAVLEKLLASRESELDYAQAKLTIDGLIDSTFDPARTAAELDGLASTALRMTGETSDIGRLASLRRLIYKAGPWNDHRPFTYDHRDPLGQSRRSRLLPVYLASRLGNCVSMPILFLILGERIGLDMTLAAAPLHIFVRWRDGSGRTFNLEATSGAHPARNAWFRKNMPMSDLAVANGLYMRSLSRREGVALMANTLLEHLIDEGRYGEAIEVAEIILRNSPRDIHALVKKATACGHIVRTEFEAVYPRPFLIPMPQRLRYLRLEALNRGLFAAAEALGWEPEDGAEQVLQERTGSCS